MVVAIFTPKGCSLIRFGGVALPADRRTSAQCLFTLARYHLTTTPRREIKGVGKEDGLIAFVLRIHGLTALVTLSLLRSLIAILPDITFTIALLSASCAAILSIFNRQPTPPKGVLIRQTSQMPAFTTFSSNRLTLLRVSVIAGFIC